MYRLNDKLINLTPYNPVSGNYGIRLDANESFIVPPADIMEKINAAVSEVQLNRYPDPYAKKLCEAFADFHGLDPDLLTAGNGSDELISIIVNSFLQKGDKVLAFTPDFSMYSFYAELAENMVVTVQKNNDLTVDVDKAINIADTEKIGLIIFSNPCNPTSLGLKKSEVLKLVKSVSALVVLDEAYMDFWDESLLSEAPLHDNLIVLRTCSKAFGSAAIRLGFAYSNEVLNNAIRAAKSPYNVNSLTQEAGRVILEHKEFLKNANAEIMASRDALYRELSGISGLTVYPTVTNFVMIKTDNAKEIYETLLKNDIVVRHLGDFLRITSGTKEENKALLKVMRERNG